MAARIEASVKLAWCMVHKCGQNHPVFAHRGFITLEVVTSLWPRRKTENEGAGTRFSPKTGLKRESGSAELEGGVFVTATLQIAVTERQRADTNGHTGCGHEQHRCCSGWQEGESKRGEEHAMSTKCHGRRIFRIGNQHDPQQPGPIIHRCQLRSPLRMRVLAGRAASEATAAGKAHGGARPHAGGRRDGAVCFADRWGQEWRHTRRNGRRPQAHGHPGKAGRSRRTGTARTAGSTGSGGGTAAGQGLALQKRKVHA